MKRHEWFLMALGSITALMLLAIGDWTLAGALVGGTGLVYGGIRLTQARPRLRLLVNYLAVLAYYSSIKWLAPTLGLTLRDAELLAIDRALFGETPALMLGGPDRLTDLFSACYFAYHLYLHGALVYAAFRPDSGRRLLPPLITAFVVGYAGYLIVPAMGPLAAFPELFTESLGGGWVTTSVRDFIARGSSIYDVFPSLHLLITLVILDYDWTHHRRRFWWVIVPACGLAISTVYLRYHYGIDLVAAVIIWALVRQPRVHGTPVNEPSR